MSTSVCLCLHTVKVVELEIADSLNRGTRDTDAGAVSDKDNMNYILLMEPIVTIYTG